MSESSWPLSASTSFSPFWSEPTMMVRRSQEQPFGDQAGETDEKERRQPQPRHFVAEPGEERGADEQQEHEGPG
jgi:hypothetical protein